LEIGSLAGSLDAMLCSVCSESDPVQDVVKVDMSQISFAEDKENSGNAAGNVTSAPLLTKGVKKQMEAAAEQQLKDRSYEDRRRSEAAEQEERRRQSWVAEEAKVAIERAEEERRARKALDEKRHAEEEEQQACIELVKQRLVEELCLEEQRQAKEEELMAAETAKLMAAQALKEEKEETERRQKQEELATALAEKQQAERAKAEAECVKLGAFLKEHCYAGVNAKRSNFVRKSKYPLHSAVKHKDAEMVRILCASGADPALKNSSGQTPVQFAQKSDKNGSHGAVLGAFHVKQ
jgi:hypothetical protein